MENQSLRISLPDIVGGGYASFWNTKKRYRVVKGGRGSKKSKTTALWFIYNMMKYPLANTVVVRQTANTHRDSTFADLRWACDKLGVSHLWKFIGNPTEATYIPTGQKILFRGFDDVLKLTSMTVPKGFLCWGWMEEAYEISNVNDFQTFDESIRGAMPEGYWHQITITFNPWVSTHWTKERFFDNEDPNAFTLTTTYRCNEWLDEQTKANYELLNKRYIGFKSNKEALENIKSLKGLDEDSNASLLTQYAYDLDDKAKRDIDFINIRYSYNRKLDDESKALISSLSSRGVDVVTNPLYNPDRYKVIGLGEYGTTGGNFFPEFRSDIHVVEPFVIPKYWNRYVVLDYGLDMLACYWVAVDTHENYYFYREIHESNLLFDDVANKIIDASKGEKIEYVIVPPDLKKRSGDTGVDIIDTLRGYNLYIKIAKNDVEMGLVSLKSYLKPYYDGNNDKYTARMQIFNNCKNLIVSLTDIKQDETHPNKTADKPHKLTHACSAARYFFAGKPSPTPIANTLPNWARRKVKTQPKGFMVNG